MHSTRAKRVIGSAAATFVAGLFAAATAPEALAVFPVGATEQHGPHLPVYTDSFTVEHIARAAAAGSCSSARWSVRRGTPR